MPVDDKELVADSIIYEKSQDNKYRYAIGTKGIKPLIFLGITPSDGTPDNPDPTMKKVIKYTESNSDKYDSYIMLNIYPKINYANEITDSDEHSKNIGYINYYINKKSCVWVAHGDLEKTPNLLDCLTHIQWLLLNEKNNTQYKMFELTSKGNPKFPHLNINYELSNYNIPKIHDEDKDRALERINKNNSTMNTGNIYIKSKHKEKQEGLNRIWFECLREIFEDAERKGKEEIEISSLDLYKYAKMKGITNVDLESKHRSINFAMHNKKYVFEEGMDEEIHGKHSDGNSTYKVKYKLPRKNKIVGQNVNYFYHISSIQKEIENVSKQKSILIKKNKIENNKLEKDNFEIINKAFRTILPCLAEFAGETLKENDNKYWWKYFVINKLPKSTVDNLPNEGSYEECIRKLDIQACLNIIEYNWLDIFKYKFNKEGKYRTWARELKDIRNDIDAHYTLQTLESFNDEDLKRALDTIARLMEPINKDISDQIRSIKNKI